MLIETYAEVNYLTTEQVKKEIKSGWIDGNMLFEEWLKYEGIFGYSEKIINIFAQTRDAEKFLNAEPTILITAR